MYPTNRATTIGRRSPGSGVSTQDERRAALSRRAIAEAVKENPNLCSANEIARQASRLLLGVCLTLAITVSAAAQTDYLYGLHNPQGVGDAGVFNLVQFAVDDPTGTPSVTPSTVLTDIGSHISGYDSASRNFEFINGLAIDTDNQRVYFQYTYGSSTTQTDGDYTRQLYSATYDSGSAQWDVALVADAGFSGTVGGSHTNSVGSGAFPRAAFHDNTYYTGGQTNDNLHATVLDANGEFVSRTNYPNFDRANNGDYGGGDISITPDETLYTATRLADENVFIRQTLANATSGSTNAPAFAAELVNFDSVVPNATNGAVQIAGSGGIGRLYGMTNTTNELLLIGNPNGANAAALNIASVANLSGFVGANGSIPDLSEGLDTSLVIPEPASAMLGLLVFLGLLGGGRCRWKRATGAMSTGA